MNNLLNELVSKHNHIGNTKINDISRNLEHME